MLPTMIAHSITQQIMASKVLFSCSLKQVIILYYSEGSLKCVSLKFSSVELPHLSCVTLHEYM